MCVVGKYVDVGRQDTPCTAHVGVEHTLNGRVESSARLAPSTQVFNVFNVQAHFFLIVSGLEFERTINSASAARLAFHRSITSHFVLMTGVTRPPKMIKVNLVLVQVLYFLVSFFYELSICLKITGSNSGLYIMCLCCGSQTPLRVSTTRYSRGQARGWPAGKT